MDSRPLVSIEAEHGVLGALLIKPELCDDLGAFLDQRAFSDADNGQLYLLILAAKSKGLRPDPVVLSEECQTLPSGDSTLAYAATIMRNITSAANGIQYGRIVRERWQARLMYQAAQSIMDMACSQGRISDQLSKAQQSLIDLVTPEETPDVITYTDALGNYFADMQDLLDGKRQIGLKFGLINLDMIVQGIRPGNLVIIAGKPGTGKTVLGTGLADKIAVQESKSALIFSLEMQAKELSSRALSSIGEINKADLDSGNALSDELQRMRMEKGVSKMKEADVRICDKPGITFARLCNIARFEHRASKLDLIVIDYLTLIASDPSSKFQTRSAEIGSFTRGLKMLAKELNLPVVVLAQLNRAMDNRSGDARPKMSDLRDSGEIEQDADVIIMGYRDEKHHLGQQGVTEWDVVKCRHAKPGRCVLQFQGEYQRFVGSQYSWDDYENALNPPQDAQDKPSSTSGYLRKAK